MDKRKKRQIKLFRSLYDEYGDIKKAEDAYYRRMREPFCMPARLIELNVNIEKIEALYDKYDGMQLFKIADCLKNACEVDDVLMYISPDYSFRQLDIVINGLGNPEIREFVIEHLDDYFSLDTSEDMMITIRDAYIRGLSPEHIKAIAECTDNLNDESRHYLIRGLFRYPDAYSKWIEKLIVAGDEKIWKFQDLFYEDAVGNRIEKIDDDVIDFWVSNTFSESKERLVWFSVIADEGLNSIKLFADNRLSDYQSSNIRNLVFNKSENYVKAVELKKCFLNKKYSDKLSDVLEACADKITKEQFLRIAEHESEIEMVNQTVKYLRDNMFSINELFDKLKGKLFSDDQSSVIFEAAHDGLPLEQVLIIANPELDAYQMDEIRMGFKQWVDVMKYAKKEITGDEMDEIRQKMLNDSLGIDL